jgi:predicted glycogen debranching enzyme
VVEEILERYIAGTRFGIRLDDDGLLAAGEPGLQLTWMDAKVGTWVVTPRIGKPIEVQCLWLNALRFAAGFEPRYEPLFRRGLSALRARFYDHARGYAYDVVDVDHDRGAVDARLRPNQILAVGGLPAVLLEEEPARRVVDTVEQRLLTPLGLRTLDPDTSEYEPRYQGGLLERDRAYHQGTVWTWLLGPFIEAWLRVRGETEQARQEARARFLPAMRAHLSQAGLGHVSEIADAAAPHPPRGCPFQAWSVAEWIRIEQLLGARLDEE